MRPGLRQPGLDAGAAGYIARETIDGTLPELLHRIAEGERRLVCLS
jgi:hypothetical protein